MMNRDSQILKAVGGLEAAQKIVDRAPEGATYYATNEASFNYYKREPFRLSIWIDDYWQSLFNNSDICTPLYISLSDLRTAIAQAESVFKVGDRVVFKQEIDRIYKRIYIVTDVDPDGGEVSGTAKGSEFSFFQQSDLRHATPAEIAVGHRIDEPQILVRPDEAEILPAHNSTASVPDDDITVLAKLHATHISIYSARISKQNKIIALYGGIILFLIAVCIALFLWGLK